jgi:GNAT superfamily N-acetyltransferase
MNPCSSPGGDPASIALEIRRLGLDDHSNVRHLHARSMRSQSGEALSDAEIAAFLAYVGSPAYSDTLLAEEVYGAFVGGQLIGTASWHVNGDDGETARIASVFVHPLFTRLGIGGRLLSEVEARAVRSGFDQLGTSTTINAVAFFERHGYQEASRGVKGFGPDCWLPVAFLRKRVLRPDRAAQERTDAAGSS